jgi:hypothetical protein
LASDWLPARADGTAVDVPIIADVVSPAGDMRVEIDGEQADIAFPNFAALKAVELPGIFAAGARFDLGLLWWVTGATPDSWSQFVHLIGEDGTAVVLADGEPRRGAYPTWAWAAGEWIADRWMLALPDNLQPGQYTLKLGFYRKDTGERMPVTQAGAAVNDGAAVLMTFEID